MTFKTNCEIVKGGVDTVPLVNIVFLLLVFLMLTSPYVLQPGIGVVALPTFKAPTASSFQGIVVTVTRDNLLFFNNQVITMDKLGQALRETAQKTRGQELIIKADGQVSYGTIVQIESIALEAGIPAINQATGPPISSQLSPR